MYNNLGQLVKVIDKVFAVQGYQKVDLDISDLPAGIYIIQLSHIAKTARLQKE